MDYPDMTSRQYQLWLEVNGQDKLLLMYCLLNDVPLADILSYNSTSKLTELVPDIEITSDDLNDSRIIELMDSVLLNIPVTEKTLLKVAFIGEYYYVISTDSPAEVVEFNNGLITDGYIIHRVHYSEHENTGSLDSHRYVYKLSNKVPSLFTN